MQPVVSVIMSTYNRADLLPESLESVLNQSYENFEFIIIDDNSTDNTSEILKKYNDNRIKVYRNSKNCGCTFNYHNAQNLAVGDFIAHIDDDDIWINTKLAKQLDYLKDNPQIVLVGSFIETFGETMLPSWVFDTDSDKLKFMMNFYNPICHSSIIYRQSFMNEYGLNYDINKKYSQDYDLYKQIIQSGGKIANIGEILVKYRMHKKRITDITESQNIQVQISDNIKNELLSTFLNKEEITKVTQLMSGFPFNKYDKNSVLEAFDIVSKPYCLKFGVTRNIIESAIYDVMNNVYIFGNINNR